MAKVKISQWDSNASGNTDINGININEGCPPSTINNAVREMMSQVKDLQGGYSGDTIPVAAGGTGATTASTARTNLGITGIATQDPASVNFTGGNITGLTNLSTGIFTATGTTTLSGTATSSGTLAVTGNFTVDGSSGTSGQFLTSTGTGNTPTWTTLTAFISGMIMLWSGSEASIPSGWVLCDGTNSTPNLQDRFVVGAGNNYAVGATGGSENAVAVDHTHTATVTDPGHRHGYSYTNNLGYSGGGGNPNTYPNNILQTTFSTNNATTGISVTVNPLTGEDGANKNLPPYYALCYIMKT